MNRAEAKPMLRMFVWVCGVFLITAAGVWVVSDQLTEWRSQTTALWDQVAVGAAESDVKRILGEPYREYDRSASDTDYYVSGYAAKKRPITGKVLIYLGRDLVLYVWLDPGGIVEECFRGSS